MAFIEENNTCHHCGEGEFTNDETKLGNAPVIVNVECDSFIAWLRPHSHPRVYHRKCVPDWLREHIEELTKMQAAPWN